MLIPLGRFLFRYRSFVPVGAYVAVLLLPRLYFPRPDVLWVSGALLVAAGAALRFWAIRHIGKRARTRGDKARYLITSGPFSLSRNPLYVANILTGCGFWAAFELHWYIPLYIALIGGFYSAVIRYEEDLLIQKFGDTYRRYMSRTPRWLPDLRIPRFPPADPYPWMQVIVAWEHSYIAILALGVLAVVLKRIYT